MNRYEIFKEVRALIAETLSVDEGEIHYESNIQDDLGADSLDIVELAMVFEEAFDIKIPDEIAAEMITVKDAISFIGNIKEIKDSNLNKIRKMKKYDIEQPSKDMEETIEENIKEEEFERNEKLEVIEKEHETLKSEYLKMAQDFDNFRNRTLRDQDDLQFQLICKSMSEILLLVDNFERARQELKPESEEAQTLHRSYQELYKQLVDILKRQGVAPMEVVGKRFDPNFHEAVLIESNNEYEEGVVIEELQRGYYLEGKVLRYALVKVSRCSGQQKSKET